MRMRDAKAIIREGNARYGFHLERVDKSHWPSGASVNLKEVWRSADYLVQIYSDADNCVERLSVNRASLKRGGWADGIPWEDLQRLKRECGRGDFDAVEIYPRDSDVVNVANMRHLWVFIGDSPLTFAWRRGKQ